jgi:hypothetical protein
MHSSVSARRSEGSDKMSEELCDISAHLYLERVAQLWL